MAKFDEIINSMDDGLIKKFHSELVKGGFYAGLINLDAEIESDINKLRNAVKHVVNNGDWIKLQTIAPDPLKQALKSLEHAKPETTSEPKPPQVSQAQETLRAEQISDEEVELKDPQKSKEFLILQQKLIKILSERNSQSQIPPKLKPEFNNIVTELIETYGMSQVEIEATFGVTRQVVAKGVKDAKEKAKDLAKLQEIELKTGGKDTTKAGIDTGTNLAIKETIEDHAKIKTKKDLEDIYRLGTYLIEKYNLPSLGRAMTVLTLVETATDAYLKQGDIYNLINDMEDEIMALKRQNQILQAEVTRLTTYNKNLGRTILSINSI
jgi:predicted XRE-type DNA-binding protein